MLAAGGGTYGGPVLYLRDTDYRAIILTEERARSLARSRKLRWWLGQKLLTAQEVKEEGRQLTGGMALPITGLPMEIFILPKKEVHDRLHLIEESGSAVKDLKRWGASILLERLDQHILTFTVEMNDPTARTRLNGSPLRDDPVRPLERGDRIRIYSFSTAAGAEEFLAEHLQSAGAEEVSLQAGRGIMMGRAVEFLNQPAIREILPVLGDPGTVTSLRETLGGVEELDILRGGLETETLLARTGISWPAAGLEAPVVKLLVDPAYRAGMEQQLAGSRAIEIVEDPAAADLMAGSEKFIWENRGRAPRAIALQIGDSSALFILNEKFLLVIASQRDKLGAGAVLVVGMQVGSEGAVLFQYL